MWRIWLVLGGVAVVAAVVGIAGKAFSKERYGMIALHRGDVDVLARTLFGEARNQRRAGMEAVAWVIVNRARIGPPRFQSTISGVCKAPYQFTCWSKSDPNSKVCAAVDESDPSFLLSLNVASAVLGGLVADPVDGADHYHTISMKPYPSWAAKMPEVKRVGSHIFYRSIPVK